MAKVVTGRGKTRASGKEVQLDAEKKKGVNGHAKGAQFERDIGRVLSMWITQNQRSNLFTRNVLSGGAHTRTVKIGIEEANIPGDIAAANPLAYEFLSHFSVECKFYKDLHLDVFIMDTAGTSFLSKTIALARKQAIASGLQWMVIAKQNRTEPIVFMDHRIGGIAIAGAAFPNAFRYHNLCNDTIMMTTLCHLTMLVSSRRFIKAIVASKDL
jgi:hypothetical protein